MDEERAPCAVCGTHAATAAEVLASTQPPGGEPDGTRRRKHDPVRLRQALFRIVINYPCNAKQRAKPVAGQAPANCIDAGLIPCAACIAQGALDGKEGW